MYFRFNCSGCGKSLKVGQEKAGRRARCPYCQQSLTVPDPGVDDESPDASGEAFNPLAELAASEASGGSGTHAGASAAGGTTAVAGSRKKRVARKARGGPRVGDGFGQGTEVSMWRSALYGFVGGAWFYLLLLPLRDYGFAELFLERGWVPYVLVYLGGWSASILLAKRQKLARQRASLLFDLLPTEVAPTIDDRNVGRFIEHVRELPSSASESFLVGRVLRGLEHFQARRSTPEAAAMLASQSEIDANTVESSYTTVKVFIWAIPIFGFIGTVMGISVAVGGFSGAMESASDISALKTSLNEVTGGLGVAFDTTLVALVLSLIISFPASALQKAEDGLLNRVDDYCNENLLKRLVDGGDGGADNSAAGVARRLAVLQRDIARLQSDQIEALKGTSRAVGDHVQVAEQRMDSIAGKLESAVGALLQRADRASQRADEQAQASADRLANCFETTGAALEKLNSVLAGLGQERVVLEVQRRGLFSRRSRSNGKA